MSKDMKLIMESFRGFLNEITDEGYVVATALQAAEARTDLTPQRFAQDLLKMDAAAARTQLLGYLDNKVDRFYLTNLPEEELKAELNYIATGSREPNAVPKAAPKPAPKPTSDIPPDQPPPTAK